VPDLPEREPRDATIEALAACLCGDGRLWQPRRDRDADLFCRSADDHGVLALVAEELDRLGLPPTWTPAIADRARRAAAADLVREGELRALVDALADAGVPPLLVKGAHLAYAIYPRPDLRPRVDTDLFVDVRQRDEAEQALRRLGYRPVPQLVADLVMYQRPFEKRRGTGTSHMVDLHWRLSNPHRFGATLEYGEVVQSAVAIPRLHPAALGPSPVHALLLACVHRVAHHHDEARLIWTYDIHLLASACDREAWPELVALACERRAAAACLTGLETSVAVFGTRVPERVTADLAAATTTEQSVAAYLRPGQPHIVRILADLRAVGSWWQAMRLTRQHVLPSASYMREVYAPASTAPLPILYARRAWRGARRWLMRP
jgi:hypothetical protein